jgi:hypothetical protein
MEFCHPEGVPVSNNNETLSVVQYPEGVTAIGSNWVYGIKPGINDEPIL